MNPLNEDELNELLRRAKAEPPKLSAGFDARVMRAYERQTAVVRPPLWHRLWGPVDYGRRFRLRNALAALVLILIGALADRTLLAAHAFREPRKPDPPVVERVVYKDCPAPSQGPGLTFNELQPVREIKPRVVRSMQDDR
ncbi:MAG TPA: hypothetical protein VGZ73_15915 [Bryobacteraceae bacterium]|jgi:hypothetical protein|nr:hypothetical protein [Bryobacteraceae bacterium]